MPQLIQTLTDIEWKLLTPVQEEAIPIILGGGDVLAAAPTGSGKTAAFALPLIQLIAEGDVHAKRKDDEEKQDLVDIEHKTIGEEFVFLNPQDKDKLLEISNDGLSASCSHRKFWSGCRASIGVCKGSAGFEIEIVHGKLARVGWALINAKRNIGSDAMSFGYGATGKKSHNRQFIEYAEPYAIGDIIGAYIDHDSRRIWFTKNGNHLGAAFDLGVGYIGKSFYPAVLVKNSSILCNFGPQGICDDVPMFTNLEASQTTLQASSTSHDLNLPVALIIEPTRDLALQVLEEIEGFTAHFSWIKCGPLVGGIKTGSHRQWHIIVGTLGKLLGMIKSKELDLSETKFLILDEADQLCSDERDHSSLLEIYSMLPQKQIENQVQVMMFSATLHSDAIKALADDICRFPTWIDLKGKDSIPETVDHVLVMIQPEEEVESIGKKRKIVFTDKVHDRDRLNFESLDNMSASEAIKILKPLILKQIIDDFDLDQALIFARTRLDCDNLAKFLTKCGGGDKKGRILENRYSSLVLHSSKRMSDRKAALAAFKDGSIRFLICTDIAARGIDIYGLPFVINMTLPDVSERYIHRVGRVGRADHIGLAISLVSSVPEKVWYHSNCYNNRKCNNTSLLNQGGCAIWYDEIELLKQIESRLGGVHIPHLNRSNHLEGREQAKQIYGHLRRDEHYEGSRRLDLLTPAINKLAMLEHEVQTSFWQLHQDYS